MFTSFDYAVMAVIGLSALRGMWRGLLAEVFGLIGWIAALLIAGRFVGVVVPYIPDYWPGGALTQWLVAFLADRRGGAAGVERTERVVDAHD